MVRHLRVEPGSGVLHLLDQAGHVLEEEVVQVLLLHVLQLELGPVLAADHPWAGLGSWERVNLGYFSYWSVAYKLARYGQYG